MVIVFARTLSLYAKHDSFSVTQTCDQRRNMHSLAFLTTHRRMSTLSINCSATYEPKVYNVCALQVFSSIVCCAHTSRRKHSYNCICLASLLRTNHMVFVRNRSSRSVKFFPNWLTATKSHFRFKHHNPASYETNHQQEQTTRLGLCIRIKLYFSVEQAVPTSNARGSQVRIL